MPLALIGRIRGSIRNNGLLETARKGAFAPVRLLRNWQDRRRRWQLDHSDDPRVIFSMIHQLNVWDAAESASGPGSTLAYTENLRNRLPVLFSRHAITRIMDAPCGDFNWMRTVVASTRIDYTGGDIVPALVSTNQKKHGSNRVRFRIFDITRDRFPDVDLWLCRDCLFHLSFREIHAALQNFAVSRVRYILLTNHRNAGSDANREIRTGGFRKLDLMAAPFYLPPEVKFRIQEGTAPDSDHEMCLWDRDQIIAALPAFTSRLESMPSNQRQP